MLLRELEPYIRSADIIGFAVHRGLSCPNDCMLFYVTEGAARMFAGENEYEFLRGDFLIIPPGTAYTFIPNPKITFIVLHFDYTYVTPFRFKDLVYASEYDPANAHTQPEIEDAPFLNKPFYLNGMFLSEQRLLEIVREYRFRKILFSEKISVIFKHILLDTVRHIQLPLKKNQIIDTVLDYIYKNYMNALTNEQIGRELNYSPIYLNRLLRSHTGISLHKFILNVRLDAAGRLLNSEKKSLTEVAAETGFYSLSHFSNAMKKYKGTNPLSLVKAYGIDT